MIKQARFHSPIVAGRRLSACAIACLVIAGCGGSDGDSSSNTGADNAFRIDTEGRLAVTQADTAGVHIIDLDSGQKMATIATSNAPSALYASPNRRYALAIQRSQDLVEFVDGGLYQEDHVDHLHDYMTDPTLNDMTLSGSRPTHYDASEGTAALFMDGNAQTGTSASVVTFSDEGIESKTIMAELALPMQMHGTAKARGDYLLTTWRAPTNTDTLPELVELYQRQGQTFEFVQRFEETCPRLHGSNSNENYTVFGCQDGVLVVQQTGETFTASKIANPPEMPADDRIGTVLGSHDLPTLIGLAGDSGVYEINPQAGTITAIDWGTDRTRVTQTFDHEGANFLLLDNLGTLHSLSVANGWASNGEVAVSGAVAEDGPTPSLDAHPGESKVFVADPLGKRIVIVDTATTAITQEVPLDFEPGIVRWLGIAGSHAHDHDHDH